MPTDSNGNYSLPASYHVQNGDTVLPVQHNPPFEDLAQAQTNRLMKDGRTEWTGDMKAGGHKITGMTPGELSTDSATVGQVGHKASFKTVADLQADTTLSYTTGPARVSEGDIVEAQGFRYEVLASDATDAHVETAGGVKLYVLPLAGKYWAQAIGIDGADGAADTALLERLIDIGGDIQFEDIDITITSTVKPANNTRWFGPAKLLQGTVDIVMVDTTDLHDWECYNISGDGQNLGEINLSSNPLKNMCIAGKDAAAAIDKNIKIVGGVFTNFTNHAISIRGYSTSEYSRNVTLDSITFDTFPDEACNAYLIENITCKNLHFVDVVNENLKMSNCRNVKVEGGIWEAAASFGVNSVLINIGSGCENITITGVTGIGGNIGLGLEKGDGRVLVSGNTLENQATRNIGVSIPGSDTSPSGSVVISGNVLDGAAGQSNIMIAGGSVDAGWQGVSITGNSCKGAGAGAINVQYVKEVVITSNIVRDAQMSVFLNYVDDAVVTGLVGKNMARDVVNATNCGKVMVSDVTGTACASQTGDGISIASSNTYASVGNIKIDGLGSMARVVDIECSDYDVGPVGGANANNSHVRTPDWAGDNVMFGSPLDRALRGRFGLSA